MLFYDYAQVIHNQVREMLCLPLPLEMSTRMSLRKVAVNVIKLRKTGFFALCASLRGLLSGLAGGAFSRVFGRSMRRISGETRKLAPLASLCLSGLVFLCSGCATSFGEKLSERADNPSFEDGMIIGGVLWGGKAAAGVLGGVIAGDYLYQTLSGDTSSSKDLPEGFDRQVEAKFLARLDGNRNVISVMNSIDWDSALYYAIRPEARDISASNFDSSAYSVDPSSFMVEILNTAYEAEPFTGQVVAQHPDGGKMLVAYVNRGVLARTGTKFDSNGTTRLRNTYREGQLRETRNFDVNGTLASKRLLHENGALAEERVYHGDGRTVRRKNFYDENGTHLETRYFNRQGRRLPQPLPIGAILVTRTRVGGELIYDLEDTGGFAFTGTVVEYHDAERSLLKREEPINFGKHHGTVMWWYRNGKKRFEAEYVNGEPEGRSAWYRETKTDEADSLEYEGFWADGKLTRATTWDAKDVQTGQVLNGNGTLIFHHPNGQKRMEETYKDGKLDGNKKPKFWDDKGNLLESVEPKYIPARPQIIIN
jgi:antitoxin component YwqK of YwqJK toxin-antitoxin module